jgi:hypothetical protein
MINMFDKMYIVSYNGFINYGLTRKHKMFTVIRIDATKNINDKDQKMVFYKEFKSEQAALKCAYKRNEMISTQAFGNMYIVYDKKNNQVLKSTKAAA